MPDPEFWRATGFGTVRVVPSTELSRVGGRTFLAFGRGDMSSSLSSGGVSSDALRLLSWSIGEGGALWNNSFMVQYVSSSSEDVSSDPVSYWKDRINMSVLESLEREEWRGESVESRSEKAI